MRVFGRVSLAVGHETDMRNLFVTVRANVNVDDCWPTRVLGLGWLPLIGAGLIDPAAAFLIYNPPSTGL